MLLGGSDVIVIGFLGFWEVVSFCREVVVVVVVGWVSWEFGGGGVLKV